MSNVDYPWYNAIKRVPPQPSEMLVAPAMMDIGPKAAGMFAEVIRKSKTIKHR